MASSAAFTLVELLVVVSIIALLISILLPSLKSARDQAKQVVCSANTSGLSKAATTYSGEFGGWLVGSPGTTGAELIGLNSPPADDAEGHPNAGQWSPRAVQIWDWAGPLSSIAMKSPLTGSRPQKFAQLAEGLFSCPSNTLLAPPYFRGSVGPHGTFDVQRLISYNTVRNYLMWPKVRARPPGYSGEVPWGPPPPPEAGWDTNIGSTSNTILPKSQLPQIDRIGNPSTKVFVADSSRFTTDTGEVDFDIAWKAGSGGAFSDGGPTLLRAYLRSYVLDDPGRRYAYRHGKRTSPGIVAVFYDGHAQYLSERQSRFPDYWWPKGTYIPGAELNAKSKETVPPESGYVVRR